MYIVYPCIARISSICYMFVPIKKIHWGNVACIKIATRCILNINIYTSPAYVCVYSKLINKREREKKRTLRTIRSTHQSIVKTVNDFIVILWKIILSGEKERCAYFSCLSFKNDLWPLMSPVIVSRARFEVHEKISWAYKSWLTLFIAIFLPPPQFVHLVTIDSFIA